LTTRDPLLFVYGTHMAGEATLVEVVAIHLSLMLGRH